MTRQEIPNQLINETSPYLLQHAHNPVNWRPWNRNALLKAKEEDKPIFLSIGYSSCHWCHVMAHEAFEDREVADLLNEYFIPIKVDKEERPDIDSLYMPVCRFFNRSGGWPLNLLLTPDQKPFFAATYLPKGNLTSRGRKGSGLMALLNETAALWRDAKEKRNLLSFAEEISRSLAQKEKERGKLSDEAPDLCYKRLMNSLDFRYGGFGGAPKFPMPQNILFLLRYWEKGHDKRALDAITLTLEAMAKGGIYDQIGGGFFRYATDALWMVPHYEKMLYDNALLAYCYTEAYRYTQNEAYKQTACDTLDFMTREMLLASGGFASALDADTEEGEGAYYLFSRDEISNVLGAEAEKFIRVYKIGDNAEAKSLPNRFGDKNAAAPKELASARRKLLHYREKRSSYLRDDKAIAALNGLAIAAFAKAGAIFAEDKYLKTADRAADFVINNLFFENRLMKSIREGILSGPGFIDDYAYFLWGVLELAAASKNEDDRERLLFIAKDLFEQTYELFWDEKEGGYFFQGKDAEKLLLPLKEIFDEAIPSGNAVMAQNNIMMYKLTKDDRYLQGAEELFEAFGYKISHYPEYNTASLGAYMDYISSGGMM